MSNSESLQDNQRNLALKAAVTSMAVMGALVAGEGVATAGIQREVNVLENIHENPQTVPNRDYYFPAGTRMFAAPFAGAAVVQRVPKGATLEVAPGPRHKDGTTTWLGFSLQKTNQNTSIKELAKEEYWVKKSQASDWTPNSGPTTGTVHISSKGVVWSKDLDLVNQGGMIA